MNYARFEHDRSLLKDMGKVRHGVTPRWTGGKWEPNRYGGGMISLYGVVLPKVCSIQRADIKIEAPPNLYEPAGRGLYHFYRNIWVKPRFRVWDSRRKSWAACPRLLQDGMDGFAYLCIHPRQASEKETILDFLRILDLHLLNPGLHATMGEAL